jgi:basic membrane lipoprotein Med (substrate-binding protein (PBP1-ABC) superfamily)
MTRNARLFAVAAVACLSAAAVVATWLAWPSHPAAAGADRVRQYSNARACLLTGSTGVSDPLASAVWAGMQGASSSTRAMVSYLPAPANATEATASPYVASLVQRQCGVIVAVGPAQVAAATASAARFRQVRFIVVTDRSVNSDAVRVSPAPATQVHSAVQAAVSGALNG